jgi:hypothetical protein
MYYCCFFLFCFSNQTCIVLSNVLLDFGKSVCHVVSKEKTGNMLQFGYLKYWDTALVIMFSFYILRTGLTMLVLVRMCILLCLRINFYYGQGLCYEQIDHSDREGYMNHTRRKNKAWSSCSVPSHGSHTGFARFPLRGDTASLLYYSFCQSGAFGPNVCLSWVDA